MQRFTWLAGAVSACLLTAAAPAMAWDVSQLGQLTSAFESGLAGSFTYQQYPWQFLTPDQCFTQNFKCAFSNPDGPYGHPVPGAPPLQLSTYLASNEAFVMIMETPPPMLYYGITPYINTRYYGSEPQNPAASGTLQVLESLQDSVNMADIGTTGSSTPGVNSFSQLAVFIMTADQTTYQQLRQQFEALGFPDSAINLLTMPVNDVPLDMGYAKSADTYTAVLRIAYPQDSDQMQDYINRAPVSFLQVTPLVQSPMVVLPSPADRIPGSGSSEPVNLKNAQSALVSTLMQGYRAEGYKPVEMTLNVQQTNNYSCVTTGTDCDGDNPDALYTHDVSNWVPSSRQDKILVVGVNHVDTGKATYISHSLINWSGQSGVFAVNSQWLQGTALTMGGVKSTANPLYKPYSQLYAFTMSYDCSGEPVCATIPEPTSSNPMGVPFGNAIGESSRSYVDPATGTRPSVNEVILPRVFILKKQS